ncbi:60S ribosomal protein L10a-3 [Platanthera guangdongensis]|uniref:60S ribosomal protein L10a-3 n=1 Tax=Platanthera guangdongensis TaxID=2320717 RepID=A0ABR2M8J4_9ASPA
MATNTLSTWKIFDQIHLRNDLFLPDSVPPQIRRSADGDESLLHHVPATSRSRAPSSIPARLSCLLGQKWEPHPFLAPAIAQLTNDSREKKRNFTKTIELQIGLKNCDPSSLIRNHGNQKLFV